MKLKFVAVLATALSAVAASAGLAESKGNASAIDPNADYGTVAFWVRASAQAALQDLVNAFNQTHKTQIQITSVPDAQFLAKFSAAVAGGDPPDVTAADLSDVPQYSHQGLLTDLTSFAHTLPYYPKGLVPAHVRSGTFQGTVYGLPFDAVASALFYNPVLFRKAGLSPRKGPKTWQELELDAAKITKLGHGITGYYFAGACGGCNAFTFLPLVWASGADIMNAAGTKATVDTPQMRAALKLYRDMWVHGYVAKTARTDNGSTWFTGFEAGKVGMVAGGEFTIAAFQAAKVPFSVTYLPGKNGRWSSYAGGDDIVVPRGAKNPSGAEQFIQWSLDAQTQIDNYATKGVTPVRTDGHAGSVYSALSPYYKVFANAVRYGRTTYTLKSDAIYHDPNGPWAALFQSAIFGGNIDAAVKRAQADFTKILNGG